MRTIVIGDLHGDWKALLAVLRAAGGIDAEHRRLPGATVIQLGDLIHGGGLPLREGVDDELCAALALGLCDAILIGNHELPHLWPDADFPRFNGMRPIADTLREALLAAYDAGKLVAVHAHERWLLSHAGAHPNQLPALAVAETIAGTIRDTFAARIRRQEPFQLFDAVGHARGGSHAYGGMFWQDWEDFKTGNRVGPLLPQIVGHTPQPSGYARHGDSWCVDAGAALSGLVSALVQDEAGGEWRPVVVSSVGEGSV